MSRQQDSRDSSPGKDLESNSSVKTEDSPPGNAGSVNQIRDILFGREMHEYEERFVHLQERLAREADQLRKDFLKQLEALAATLNSEVKSLTNQIKTEEKQRTESAAAIVSDLGKTNRTFEKRVSDLDQRIEGSLADLRQGLGDKSKDLADEIRKTNKDLTAAIDKQLEELRASKTDRVALSALLAQVAERLKDEGTEDS